ncbi:MAG: patatin-like phospholipase family protein [Chloroflexota bacterium]|nr:patatin-like phospholipase family protein [Chloroflexota bacterium]
MDLKSEICKTPKIGLALGAGSARGWAHVGVLKALEESSIPIDMISGTSMGAVIGALYAKERRAAILEEIALGVDWKQVVNLADLNLVLGKGLIHGRKIREILRTIIGDVKFEDLGIPLAIVAADAQTSEEIVFTEGSVIEAVRASISLPVIFTPVKWEHRFLIDGGVVNPVPVEIVRDMGAEVVIAVNVISEPQTGANKPGGDKIPDITINLRFEDTHLVVIKNRIDGFIQESKSRIKVFERPYNIVKTEVHRGKKKVNLHYPNDERLLAIREKIDASLRGSKDKAKVLGEPYIAVRDEIYRGKERINIRYSNDERLSAVKKKINAILREGKSQTKLFGELSDAVKTEIDRAKGGIDPQTPHMLDVLMQSIEAMQYERISLRIKTADIIISPDVSCIKSFEFYNAGEAISQGYKATKDILPRLQEMLHSSYTEPLC